MAFFVQPLVSQKMTEFLYRWCRPLTVVGVLCLAGCASLLREKGDGGKESREVPVVRCPRTGESIAVDAKSDESSWNGAAAVNLVTNDGPETYGAPRLGTDVKLMYDDTYLYAFFLCEDDDVRVDYHHHDDPLWNSYESLELVELMLDPQGRGREYFEINVTPNGIVLDLRVKRGDEGLDLDVGWDVEGMLVATRILSVGQDGLDGWAVELAIPWSALEQPAPSANDAWRINVYRGDGGLALPRLSWSATGEPDYHMPDKFGVVVFDG
jgi:hypothetical protein